MPSDWKHLPIDMTNFFLSSVIDIFFRDIETRGSHRIPKEGALFFVGAPHANQFLDPIVLQRHTGRRISYLIAKKSYDRPLIGHLSKLVGSIPVARSQDYAKRGSGKLKLVTKYNNPLLITGTNTEFTKELKVKSVITLDHPAKLNLEVVEVLNDTELLIKKEIGNADVIDKLEKEGLEFKYVPHIDQKQMYQAVHDTLNKGECVGIFPEGGSHDRTSLLPLKAGIAIMALGAMASNPDLDVKIIPCGLNYFHPDKFRSRAVVDYGHPITIPLELVQRFKMGGSEKRTACSQLLATILAALKDVTINTPDYETLKVVQAGRRLYRNPSHKLKISQVVELNRRLVEGYLHFKDEPRVIELKKEVLEYNADLETYGLRDHQVKSTQINRARATIRFFRRLITVLIFSIITLPGALLNAPVFYLASTVSKRKQKEALASSTVKVAAKDVISSWKLLIALGVVPTLYTFYSILTYLLVTYYLEYTWKQGILISILVLILLPSISMVSLVFGERGLDIYRSLYPLFINMCGKTDVKLLQVKREQLRISITQLINDIGPQLFPDLDKFRLVEPQSNLDLDLDLNQQLPTGVLTPTTMSSLNWLLSPFEAVGERLFSDSDDNQSSDTEANESSTSTSKEDLKLNQRINLLKKEFKPKVHSPLVPHQDTFENVSKKDLNRNKPTPINLLSTSITNTNTEVDIEAEEDKKLK